MTPYDWPSVDRFQSRLRELALLEQWYGEPHPPPLAVYGRRRVGKSWLLRRFAHGKPAVVLVGERLAEGMQFDRFAKQLAPQLGFTPRFDDLAELIAVLLRLGRTEPVLVVLDEFPYLLPNTSAAADQMLSRIQAVLEDELPATQCRMVFSGSTVAQMTSLLAERNPLHGRLRPFELRPLAYAEATDFLDPALTPVERFERFAICGGTARYLELLGSGPLDIALASALLGPNAPLWIEGRAVVEQEMRQPAAYFGLLELLASGDKEMNELAQGIRADANVTSKYLSTLVAMRLVTRRLPAGSPASARSGSWRLDDPFLRFWFRFVFPHQADLEAGLPAEHVISDEIRPLLATHVAGQFEEWARTEVRRAGLATNVGAWWGPARHDLRRAKVRSSEEIDIVGVTRGAVSVVGEVKWTTKPMPVAVLDDLLTFKLPALEQSGLRLAAPLAIRLYSRAGYEPALHERAATDRRIELVDVTAALDR